MPDFYPLRVILRVCLLVTAAGVTHPALAVSKGYKAPAQVILKDDVPCFFAEMGTLSATGSGKTLTVADRRGAMAETWKIEDRYAIERAPSSAGQCIKYGTPWPTGITVTPPKPLQYGVQYYAEIWIAINYGARFRVEFCLLEDANGKPRLTQWANDGNLCSDRPLSDGDKS